MKSCQSTGIADTKDYQFPDHLLNKLRDRLVKNAVRFLAELLIPINLNKLKQEDELHIHYAYRADLQTQQEFTLEVKRWKARCKLYPTDKVKPSHLCETLELVNEKKGINISIVFWKFILQCHHLQKQPKDLSAFWHKDVKTYLHVTMWLERLSSLALLHIYRDIQLPLDAVIDKFNNTRQRKLLKMAWLPV